MRLSLRPIVALSSLALASGCYAYYDTASTPAPGRRVELWLSDSGSVMLAAKIGPSAEFVRGEIAGDSSGSYVIAIQEVEQRNGDVSDWKGEHVVVPHVLVAQMRERHFSPARSTLFSAGVVGALAGAMTAFGGWGGSNAPGGTNPPPKGQ